MTIEELVAEAYPIGSIVEYLGADVTQASVMFEVIGFGCSGNLGPGICIRQGQRELVVSAHDLRAPLAVLAELRRRAADPLSADALCSCARLPLPHAFVASACTSPPADPPGTPMNAYDQIKILSYLAETLSVAPRSQATLMEALERWFGDVSPRPKSFASLLEGALRRGWIVRTPDGYAGTGALWMFERVRWSGIALAHHFRGLRDAIEQLVDEIVMAPADVLLEMDSFGATLSPDMRALAWETLLAAAPGLALQRSSPRDPKISTSARIRLSPAMLDKRLLLGIVDMPRESPHPRSLPLELPATSGRQ